MGKYYSLMKLKLLYACCFHYKCCNLCWCLIIPSTDKSFVVITHEYSKCSFLLLVKYISDLNCFCLCTTTLHFQELCSGDVVCLNRLLSALALSNQFIKSEQFWAELFWPRRWTLLHLTNIVNSSMTAPKSIVLNRVLTYNLKCHS